MKTLQDIVTLLNDCNIILEYQILPEHVLGIYHGDSNMDLIIINQYITTDKIQHRIILAEELGHYFTTIGNNTPKKYYKYSDMLKVDKCEEKAMRWATNYLVPDQQLIDLVSCYSMITIKDCCKTFEVTEDFMKLKFKDMALRNPYWKLSDGRYLNLASLPSVYIMDMKGCD